ncbi:MAG: hypothetical protein ACKOQ4_13390 [Mycobacterium sp.]
MARLARLVSWTAALMAVPATVAFAPVHPPEPLRWEPQVVAAGGPVMPPELTLGAVRPVHRGLPPGVGNERGLQVQTLLAERAISAAFPEVKEIGGVRPDSMKWHPNGLAIDVIIPDWDTPEGRALGDRITEFAFDHADEFGLEYVIWQQTYRPAKGTPHLMPDYGSPDANHYTHVHISSYGGGYPKGDETYSLD